MRTKLNLFATIVITAVLMPQNGPFALGDDKKLLTAETVLRKVVEAAKAKVTIVEKAFQATQGKAKGLSDALRKLQADLSKAQADLKTAEEKLKTQQAEVKKAADAKTSLDKAAAEAAKAVLAAQAVAKATTKKAAAAAKTLAETQVTVKAAEDVIASTKKTVTDSPGIIKNAEEQVAKFKPEFEQAETQLASVSAFSLIREKALEEVLIAADKMVSFSETVAPIFAKRCLACHNARTAKGRFNMESFAGIMKGGESGEAITAGDGDFSNLVVLVEEGSMPEDADPLTKDQIASIKKWINTGAQLNAGIDANSQLITIIPKLPQPAPPVAYRVPLPITALEFSPDGKLLASSGYHELILWNPTDGKQIRRITNVAERVYDIDFSADGKTVAVAAGTPAQMGEVKLFSVADGKLLADLVTSTDSVYAVAFSPDGKRLATAGADRAIRVYDVTTGKEQLLIEDHADWVMDIAWSSDGSKLASASRDKTSKVFDTKTGDSLVTFNGHGEPVFGVGFSPDGKQVVTSGRDKQIRVWNVSDAKQARAIGGFGNEVFRISVTKEGDVYSASADKTARLHKIADGKVLKTFSGHNDWVYSVAYHTAGKKVATGSYDGEIRIWNFDDAKTTVNFIAAPGYKPPAVSASASK